MAETNQLHKFASYNALFTISGLAEDEITNLKYLSAPVKNVIARSAGITDSVPRPGFGNGQVSVLNIDASESEFRAVDILNQKRDIFIDDVNILSTASPNFERNLGTFTKIEFKMTEPYQCSLLDKLKGAAALGEYIDYHDAPFLLTIDFRGFDEKGGVMSLGPAENLTRKIPIMIVKVEFDINEGGTTYQVQAVPYLDIAYDDRYKHVRKQVSVTLNKGETYEHWGKSVENHINTQGISVLGASQMDVEIKQGLRQLPDYYAFRVHKDLKGKLTFSELEKKIQTMGDTGQPKNFEKVDEGGIYPGGLTFNNTNYRGEIGISNTDGPPSVIAGQSDVYSQLGVEEITTSELRKKQNTNVRLAKAIFTHTFNPGDALPKVIEDVVRLSDPFSLSVDSWYKNFAAAAGIDISSGPNNRELEGVSIIKRVYEQQNKINRSAVSDYLLKNSYIDWFRVVPSVYTMYGEYDNITNMHPKMITYTVIPYKVHINKFIIPGVTIPVPEDIDEKVRKSYNYIYTGDNVDVLNFHINYKAAFFLRNHMPEEKTQQESGYTDRISEWLKGLFTDNPDQQIGDAETMQDNSYNTLLDTRQFPSLIKSKNTVGGIEDNPRGVAFFDYLTNPEADMLRVDLEILGDPAYISDKTFIPTQQYYQDNDATKDYENGQFLYNNYLPVINMNFRFPDDPVETQGTYFDNRPTSKLFFNGLYQLIKIDSKFEQGRFTQVLHLARLLNQDGKKSNVIKPAIKQDKAIIIPKKNPGLKIDTSYKAKAKNIGETVDVYGNKKTKEQIIEEADIIARQIKGF